MDFNSITAGLVADVLVGVLLAAAGVYMLVDSTLFIARTVGRFFDGAGGRGRTAGASLSAEQTYAINSYADQHGLDDEAREDMFRGAEKAAAAHASAIAQGYEEAHEANAMVDAGFCHQCETKPCVCREEAALERHADPMHNEHLYNEMREQERSNEGMDRYSDEQIERYKEAWAQKDRRS